MTMPPAGAGPRASPPIRVELYLARGIEYYLRLSQLERLEGVQVPPSTNCSSRLFFEENYSQVFPAGFRVSSRWYQRRWGALPKVNLIPDLKITLFK